MDANQNFFALLGDDENEDPTPAVVAKYAAPSAQKPKAKKQEQKPPLQQASAKLPTKPLPPAEAVRAEREAGRGRGVRSGRGRGRSFGESYVSDRHNESYGTRGRGGRGGYWGYGETAATPEGERSHDGGRGRGRRGGFGRGFDGDEDQKRGTGEDVATQEEVKTAAVDSEVKVPQDVQQEVEQKKEEEEDDKEMTLDEYEKILEEKRKALEALKTEERKVQADNDFKAMQLVDKKTEDDIFIKLSSDKEKLKKKESAEKDDKMKKAMSINEFLKPAEGDKFSPRGGRAGMRGGRGRGAFGRYNSGYDNGASTPSIEDPQQFPELGKK